MSTFLGKNQLNVSTAGRKRHNVRAEKNQLYQLYQFYQFSILSIRRLTHARIYLYKIIIYLYIKFIAIKRDPPKD